MNHATERAFILSQMSPTMPILALPWLNVHFSENKTRIGKDRFDEPINEGRSSLLESSKIAD